MHIHNYFIHVLKKKKNIILHTQSPKNIKRHTLYLLKQQIKRKLKIKKSTTERTKEDNSLLQQRNYLKVFYFFLFSLIFYHLIKKAEKCDNNKSKSN